MKNIEEKLRKIEALIKGAKTAGEKNAAESAKKRILKKYPHVQFQREKIEFTIHTVDHWHKKLLIAILRKYGLHPYRYKGQKYTTVMVKVDKTFLNEIVWKEYEYFAEELEALIEEITDSVIAEIHEFEDEQIKQK